LVVVKHHSNIIRLLHGTEGQLKESFLMNQLNKSLHVLAMGMWFGMAVFFTFVVGLSLFDAFEALGEREGETETWFQRPVIYALKNDAINGPKEQGTRAAGFAVTPLFNWYFAIQGVCGFVALATALPGLKNGGALHRWRINLLLAAVILVVVGWPLEQYVHRLSGPRNQLTETYLLEPADSAKKDAMKVDMLAARSEFAQWHVASILVNLAVVVLVTAATALAGNWESKETSKQDGNPAG
jgi:hypothetical protein